MSTDILNDVETSSTQVTNKASAIRKALQVLSNKDADVKPNSVVEYLQTECGIEVSATYVSLIKTQLVNKMNNHSFEVIRQAKKLIREAGNVINAKRALDSVMEEYEQTASIRAIYEGQLLEIDMRLDDDTNQLDPKDRRELANEKKRIQKVLQALEET